MNLAEPRVTAYYYVYSHSLMEKFGDISVLWRLGQLAAGEARWQGIEPVYVYEGPYVVNTWPESLWGQVIVQLEREEQTAFADAATAQDEYDQAWPPHDNAGY